VQNIGVQREDEFGGVIADFDTRGIDLRIVAAAPSSSGCLDSSTLTVIVWQINGSCPS
jgi:hypothetical protein